jgi:predicted GNAT superfamily acetyltransferase
MAQQIIWRNKLEEHAKNPNFTYFGKQYEQIFLIDVIFTNDVVYMHLTHATTRDAFHNEE